MTVDMNTTIFKANTTVKSRVNMKYWVIDRISDTSDYIYIGVYFSNIYNSGESKTMKVLTYNGTLNTSSNYGGNISSPSNYLVGTTVVGEDTIYEYVLPIPVVRGIGTINDVDAFFVSIPASCTRAMIEEVEDVHVSFYNSSQTPPTAPIYYIDKESFLMHYSRVQSDVPVKKYVGTRYNGDYQTSFARYNALETRHGIMKADLADFNDLYQYSSYIDFYQNSEITGDIVNIAERINITTPMNSPYACNGARIYISACYGLYGDLTSFVNAILARDARNLAVQVYWNDNPNMTNNPAPSTLQCLFYINTNGDVSYYATMANFLNALPKNS